MLLVFASHLPVFNTILWPQAYSLSFANLWLILICYEADSPFYLLSDMPHAHGPSSALRHPGQYNQTRITNSLSLYSAGVSAAHLSMIFFLIMVMT